MKQINLSEELQLLDSAMGFLARSQISGSESERMSQVKDLIASRMQNIHDAMKRQAEQQPTGETTEAE